MLVFINSISDKPWYLMQKLLLRTSNEEQKTLTEKKKPKKWDMDFQRVQRYVSKSSTFKILDYDEEDNDNKCHELRNTQIRRYKPGSIEPRFVSHFTYFIGPRERSELGPTKPLLTPTGANKSATGLPQNCHRIATELPQKTITFERRA